MPDIEKRQLAKKRQLLKIKNILDDMGVRFWLHSGVLLGYYRERDLIRHDPDLDIGVIKSELPEDFPYKLAKRLENTGMRMYWKTETCVKICVDSPNEEKLSHIDIFMHDGNLSDGLKLKLNTEKTSVEYDYPIHDFVKVKFLGAEFLVPSNPREAVVMQYGSGWEKPVMSFQWDTDPGNISGKRKVVPNDIPEKNAVYADICKGYTGVFGPVTGADVSMLSENCGKAVVFSEQNLKSLPNVKCIRCDETHDVGKILPDAGEQFDSAIVTHPEMYNVHNARTMLESAWKHMKEGAVLTFCGEVPECISEFMFDQTGEKAFVKYEMHENWEKNVTAVITTFESPEMAQKCVDAIKKQHKDMRVIVVDNSSKAPNIKNARLLSMPEDSGLSACRNAGVLHVQTPYVLLLDDDQMLTDPVSVKKMYESLNANKLDLVGGAVVNSNTKVPAMYFGKIERGIKYVRVEHGSRGKCPDGTVIFDLVLNFFVAKTDILKKVKWRNELKLCEHLDFFMRAKEKSVAIGYIASSTCLHLKAPMARTVNYSKARNRGMHFRKMMMRLNGLETVFEFDTVSWKYEDLTETEQKPRTATSRPKTKNPAIPARKSLFQLRPDLFKRRAKK